ncbi:MAG: DUF3263 domain-containing protein [Euzebyales bacterium]|nr:DUF3263 domain-containing protein [Euzebyales bacterium]
MSGPPDELDARDCALVDFEREWSAHRGAKDTAIRQRFGVSPARYYQLLARVIDLAAAEVYDPLTVRRLRRRRHERARRRAARELGERTSR